MDPLTASLIAAGVGAAGSIGGGYLSSRGNKETKIQRQQRKLIDEVMASMRGEGKYSELFQTSDEAFNRSFVEPSKARFSNQIAPAIQQQYIASGQQRGSGLDDQLLRAGVDLNQLLNESYLGYQEKGKDRMSNMINSILGQSQGAPPEQSTGQSFAQATGGYMSSDAFSNAISDIYKNYNRPQMQQRPSQGQFPRRRGYETDYMSWQLGDPRWGQS